MIKEEYSLLFITKLYFSSSIFRQKNCLSFLHTNWNKLPISTMSSRAHSNNFSSVQLNYQAKRQCRPTRTITVQENIHEKILLESTSTYACLHSNYFMLRVGSNSFVDYTSTTCKLCE